MIELRNFNLRVGKKSLLENVSFRIGDTDRIGLVGVNGAGKTTILRFLANAEHDKDLVDTQGEYLKSSTTTIGYLPQEVGLNVDSDITALEFSITPIFRQQRAKLTEYEYTLSHATDFESDEYMKTLNDYGELSALYESSGGYQIQSEAEKTLSGLGFSKEDFQKPVKKFSGGWQMRLLMTQLLLEKPTMLFLDEPTNHLDIDSVAWLEDYLSSYPGAIVVVSHDRFFLENLTTKILEISLRTINEYAGSYSFYETEKVVRYEAKLATHKQKQKEIGHLQDFVDRFRYKATKARQAQSRLRMIEKLSEKMENPEESIARVMFSFPKAPRSGEIVASIKDISKHYVLPTGEIKQILSNVSLEVIREDKIAVVGPNGAGKSTLCKIIASEITSEGTFKLGHNVKLNFYHQHQADTLNGENTVFDEALSATNVLEIQQKARNILGSFLFSGDDVYKKVKVLSGGEKARLALAKLLMQEANFLILDEPTNHLDIYSKEILMDSLQDYTGSALVVSHDRYFLDEVCTKVWEVQNGTVKEYLCSYSEYTEKKMEERKELKSSSIQPSKVQSKSLTSPQPKQESKQDVRHASKKDFQKVETDILRLETTIKEIELTMSETDFYKSASAKKTEIDYKKKKDMLTTLYAKWETMSDVMAVKS